MLRSPLCVGRHFISPVSCIPDALQHSQLDLTLGGVKTRDSGTLHLTEAKAKTARDCTEHFERRNLHLVYCHSHFPSHHAVLHTANPGR